MGPSFYDSCDREARAEVFFSISFVKLRSCKNVKRFDGKLLQEKKLNNDGNNFTTFFP